MKQLLFLSAFCIVFVLKGGPMSQINVINSPAAQADIHTPQNLASGFVYLKDIDPTIIEDVRYATAENFTGRPVPGYETPHIICTHKAAQILQQVHTDLKLQGYSIVVYDGYRPQRAVDSFARWGENHQDNNAKHKYYPTINKEDVFEKGFIARRSAHSRGSTFDLTLIPLGTVPTTPRLTLRRLQNGEVIPHIEDGTCDMGSSFDLFHEVSFHNTPLITGEQARLRNLLKAAMEKRGFEAYEKEWWHYQLKDEPYPDTYFDFVG